MDRPDRDAQARGAIGGDVEEATIDAAEEHAGDHHPTQKPDPPPGPDPHPSSRPTPPCPPGKTGCFHKAGAPDDDPTYLRYFPNQSVASFVARSNAFA